MRRIKHAALTDTGTIRFITETAASGGGTWARPVALSLIEIPANEVRTFLQSPSWSDIRRWNVLERSWADSRHQGQRSGYGRTLAGLIHTCGGSQIQGEMTEQNIVGHILGAVAQGPYMTAAPRRM